MPRRPRTDGDREVTRGVLSAIVGGRADDAENVTKIAEASPDAAGAITAYLLSSADDRERGYRQRLEYVEGERDRYRARAEWAEAQLELVHHRLTRLVWDEASPDELARMGRVP